ncbi:hypothetical protein HKD37_06G016379 [Glycine soja]
MENIIHFFWFTLHGSLPTIDFRVYKHVSFDLSCISSLYVVTCWTLWKAKNASVFYDKNLDIWRLINQVNTDGSSKGSLGRLGFDDILRHYLTWDDGFCFVTCESDSQMALDLICDPPTTFHP